MSVNITLEKSTEEAKKITDVLTIIRTLDLEYLKVAMEDMNKNHAFKENASILSPNPVLQLDLNELEAVKLKTLKLLLDLAQNQEDIKAATLKFEQAKRNSRDLSRMFGL